jgi:hypothetical protein
MQESLSTTKSNFAWTSLLNNSDDGKYLYFKPYAHIERLHRKLFSYWIIVLQVNGSVSMTLSQFVKSYSASIWSNAWIQCRHWISSNWPNAGIIIESVQNDLMQALYQFKLIQSRLWISSNWSNAGIESVPTDPNQFQLIRFSSNW